MWIVIEKDYDGSIVDTWGPFITRESARKWIKGQGFATGETKIQRLRRSF